MQNQTYTSKTSQSLNDLKLNSKSYKTQQSLALQKENKDSERCLTGSFLFFSEEWFDCHASTIKIVISHHQGYICFLACTADNFNKLLSPTSCTEVALRSHKAGP